MGQKIADGELGGSATGIYVSDYGRSTNTLSGKGGTGTYQISWISANNVTTGNKTNVTGTKPAGNTARDYLVYYPTNDWRGYWQRTIIRKTVSNAGVTTIQLNSNPTNTNDQTGWLLIYSYGAAEDKAIFEVDKALIKTIPAGKEFGIGRTIRESSERSDILKAKMFKTRILDIEEDGANKKINVYCTDELPWDWDDNDTRHYGLAILNHGGWTYPKTGGSSFRVNNVKTAGGANNKILLPNRSQRIQAGDTLTYTYENEDIDGNGVGGDDFGTAVKVTLAISAVSNVSSGYSECTLSGTTNILFDGYTAKHRWLSIGDIFVSHRTGNFVNNGPVCDKFIYTDTGLKMQFGDYNIWYENWSNYISSRRGITGRAGWVGNFALADDGKVPVGIDFNGASSLQWGRQYNKGLWLAATPITPKWMPGSYSPYMAQIQYDAGIEASLSYKSTAADFGENNGSNKLQKFYTINHSTLTSGNVFAGLDTSSTTLGSTNGGTDAYDTLQYRWSPTNTKLDYSLQDASIDTTNGNVPSGGNNSRVSEGLTISNVVHYKPVKHFETCNHRPNGTLTAATNTPTVTGSSTTFTASILPGDHLYSNETGTPAWIGEVKSVDNDTQMTLVTNAASANSDTSWSVISSRVKLTVASPVYTSGEFNNAPKRDFVMSGGALASGVSVVGGSNWSSTGYNVINSSIAGYQSYNFRFGIQKRTYNQTPLLNTKGELTVVNSTNNASKIVKTAMGDLSRYLPANFNVEVTRLNPKTHVERSISIVGAQANI